ncbi:MAG: type II toxin-antitoxin system HicB family antitoxin [Thermoguttaceae bacterium]
MTRNFTVFVERDPESGMFVGTVPSLPGAHTYADTLDDLQIRLTEVISLCLEEMEPFMVDFVPVIPA